MRKIFLTLVTLLWIAAGIQITMNLNQADEQKLVEAFGQVNYRSVSSKIKVNGDFKEDYLSAPEQEKLLKELALELGISGNYNITAEQIKNKKEIILQKKAAKAETVMKLVTIEYEVDENTIQTKQYFLMELSLSDSVESAITLKKTVEKMLKSRSFDFESSLLFEGEMTGNISMEEKNKMTAQLLDNLKANIIEDERTKDLYSVYAYTKLIEDEQKIDGGYVNLNIVMNYDENENVTHIYVASPFMKEDF